MSKKEIDSAYKEFVAETSKLLDGNISINTEKLLHLSKSHKIVNGVLIPPIQSFYKKPSSSAKVDKSVSNIKPSSLTCSSKATKNLEVVFSAMESDKDKPIEIAPNILEKNDSCNNNAPKVSSCEGKMALERSQTSAVIVDNLETTLMFSHQNFDPLPDISGITSISLDPPPSPVLELTDDDIINAISPDKHSRKLSYDSYKRKNMSISNESVPDILLNVKNKSDTDDEPCLTITKVWSKSEENTIPGNFNITKPTMKSPVRELRLIDSLKKKKKSNPFEQFDYQNASKNSVSDDTDSLSDQYTIAYHNPMETSKLNERASNVPLVSEECSNAEKIIKQKGKKHSRKNSSTIPSKKFKNQKKNMRNNLKLKIKLKHKRTNSKKIKSDDLNMISSLPKFSDPQIPLMDLVSGAIEIVDDTTTDESVEVDVVGDGMDDITPISDDINNTTANGVNTISENNSNVLVNRSVVTEMQESVTQKPILEASFHTTTGTTVQSPISELNDKQYGLVTVTPKQDRNNFSNTLEPVVMLSDVLPTLTPCQKNQLRGKEQTCSEPDTKEQTDNVVNANIPTVRKKLRPRPDQMKEISKHRKNRERSDSEASNIERRYRTFKFIRVKKLKDYNEIVIAAESVLEKKQDTDLRREYNFLGAAALKDLINAFAICKKRKNCKAVLLSSVGPIFCTGLNPQNMLEWASNKVPSKDIISHMEQLIEVLIDFHKPIIGAVQGPASGLGATLLLFCDSIYASNRACFQWPYAQMGLPNFGCSSSLLCKSVGFQRAKSLIIQGNSLTATAAKMYGLVTEVFPHDSFMRHAVTACQGISLLNSSILGFMKQSFVSEVSLGNLKECNSRESALLRQCLKSKETQQQLEIYISTQLQVL